MPTTKSSVGWLARALACIGLALVAGHASPQTVTYFHNDAAGSPMVATDASGNVVWKESYRPYGERVSNPPAEAGNSIGFAGKPFDPRTGLSYLGGRYYDPGIGRFVAVDPAAPNPDNVHGIGRYGYANDNPYRYVDPDGRSPLDVAFLIWDLGKLATAINKGAGVHEAATDVVLSVIGVVVPAPGVGQALKGVRALEHSVGFARTTDVANAAAKAPTLAKETIVLGHYPAYRDLGKELGARILNIPTPIWNKMTEAERWAANQRFLDRAIRRGDDIALATPLSQVKPGSYFEKELDYLMSKGLRPNVEENKLMRPPAP